MAARLPTLSAAIVPVVVGSAAAQAQGAFNRWAFVAALFSAVMIQIGTNLANDLFDFQKGADTAERVGPVRVTQAKLLTPQQVARGTVVSFGLAFLSGLYLIAIGGWPIFLVGLAAITAGVLYTGGPWPLAYRGLGDLFTFVFFGPVAVIGTYYVHTGRIDPVAWIASIPVGFLVTAILVVNNLRDIETDRAAGKNTLAVRIGKEATQLQYLGLVAFSYALPIVLYVRGDLSHYWLPWLTFPLSFLLIRLIFSQTGRALNKGLKGTGLLHLLFGLLFAAAFLL